MKKKILFVVLKDSEHLVSELPRLFKKAGFQVHLMASPHWLLNHSTFVDEFIPVEEDLDRVIDQALELIFKNDIDLTIVAPDLLNWALVDSKIDLTLKLKLSCIGNPTYFDALGGKIESAIAWEKLGILSPCFKVANSIEGALVAAEKIGFPLMVKDSRSGAGDSVFKCSTKEELLINAAKLKCPFLLQEYIEGELLSVEPFYLDSRLLAYGVSKIGYTPGPFLPSLERIFMPCPEIEPVLQKLGIEMGLTGFVNISFILEQGTNKPYLFETDFRPNRWVRHSELAGVNWIQALKEPKTLLQRPKYTKRVRLFPFDLVHAIKSGQKKRIFYWLLNQNNCWASIPYKDPGLLFGMLKHYFSKLMQKLPQSD